MNKKIAMKVVLGIMIIIAVIIGGLAWLNSKQDAKTNTIDPSQKACSQEAKQCPDGSYVGRTGPNCEFICSEDNKKEIIRPGKNINRGICVDKCGDGRCEEIVCLGEGCPCTESVGSCPQDCKN